jgi:penicillin-binding protein 1A
MVVLTVLGLAAGAVLFERHFLRDLPDLRRIEDYAPPVTSVVLDRRGRLIGEFYDEQRRLVPIGEIPRHVQLAFVAAEDKHFFEHKGIDYTGILRAAIANLRAGGEIKQGASTITQQMVKSLLLTPERTYRRKIREMILARRIEEHFTKDEILYLYVNQIYFGHGAWGIGQAARGYFGKKVKDLSVSESALLAGLVQRPSSWSPYASVEAAERRRRYVLGRMHADGFIDRAAYDEALASPPIIQGPGNEEDMASSAHFTELVRRYLFERLGGDTVLKTGLVIETTLDLDLQKAAVVALRAGLEAHDHRQGWRGPIRHVDAPGRTQEIAMLSESNAEHWVRAVEEAGSGEAGSEKARGVANEVDLDAGAEEALPDVAANGPDSVEALSAETGEVEEWGAEVLAEPLDPNRLSAELLPFDEPLVGIVTEVDREAQTARVSFAPEVFGQVRLEDIEWARPVDPKRRPRPVKDIGLILSPGDVANFVRLEDLPPEELPEEETDEVLDEQDLLAEAEAARPLTPMPRLGIAQRPIVQGALLSFDNHTGDVLSLVGGYDYQQSEFNRATQALRQPGSAFKPFIYGAALEKGLTPVSKVIDRPIVYTDPISGYMWRPRNYGRHFFGPMPMRNALKKSINNATVHLFRDVGVDFVIDYARRFGIQSPLSRDLSLALGSSSVTLLELTTAYAVFPNFGRRVVPRFITRVTRGDGQVLLKDVPLGNSPPPIVKPLVDEREPQFETYPDAEILPTDQIISNAAAYLMCDLLKAVVQEGTGRRLRSLGRPLAGKTGTTNDQGDAWFMGFSPDVTTGVWVGHDDNQVLGFGETGAGAALPIWKDYMAVALADLPIRDFDVPHQNIVFQRIDRDTGLLADAGSKNAYFQPFIEGTEPIRGVSERDSATESMRAMRDDVF